MSQDRVPGIPASTQGIPRHPIVSPPALFIGAAAVLALIVSLVVPWHAAAHHTAATAVSTSVLLDAPNSGLPGTTVSLSGLGLPRTDDSTSYTRTLTYDKLAFASPAIIQCPPSATYPNGTFGFGVQCDATAPAYQFQIPAGATAGAHTFQFTVVNVDGATVDAATAQFTVTAPPTDTPTATATPTNTSTSTATATATAAAATATNTAVPSAPTATNTNTPLPSAPTATNTAIPTATATPVKKIISRLVVLVRPDFNRDIVAIALRDSSHATVKTEFAILIKSQGTTKTAFSMSQNGVSNALGVYSYNVHIHFPAHTPGEATLTITVTDAGGTKTASRTYRYRVSTS